jgi:hypothetical protein
MDSSQIILTLVVAVIGAVGTIIAAYIVRPQGLPRTRVLIVLIIVVSLVGGITGYLVGGAIVSARKTQGAPTALPATPGSTTLFVCPNNDPCIKGYINDTGERIYHYPGCPNYDQTQIDAGRNERYFTTSAEAEATGWHRAENCPK